MARKYAPILPEIWSDADFRALSADAQRVYLLAFSQPNITYAGVVPYTARRWARMCSDTTPDDIDKAIDELRSGERPFVVLDEETEELWVRSFVKNNEILRQPNLAKAMWASVPQILSPTIRAAFDAMIAALPEPQAKGSRKGSPNPTGTPPEGLFDVGNELDAGPVSRSSSSTLDLDPDPSSSSTARDEVDNGGDPHAELLHQAFTILAGRNLERRNRQVGRRDPNDVVVGTSRRDAWIRKDVLRSYATLSALARRFASGNDLTAVELADLLDTPEADEIGAGR